MPPNRRNNGDSDRDSNIMIIYLLTKKIMEMVRKIMTMLVTLIMCPNKDNNGDDKDDADDDNDGYGDNNDDGDSRNDDYDDENT